MLLPRPPSLATLVRGAGVSIAVLSRPLHRGSLANAQGALFARRRAEVDALRDWRELEPRLQSGVPGPTGEAAGLGQ